jgi:hypothetical protein
MAQAGVKPSGVEWKAYEPVWVPEQPSVWSMLVDLLIIIALTAAAFEIWRLM